MRPGLPALFASLATHEVRYVLVGGLAAVLHGVPRSTLDVDLLIEARRENAERLLRALGEAGLGTAHLTTAAELLANTITLFEDQLRVDVFLSIPGVGFEDAWRERATKDAAGVPVHILSRDLLIRAKRAAGRPKDLEDVADLLSLRDDGREGGS